ncbi:MAG: hypothetical protein ACXW61_03820 [Gemmatirosa sp.]
MPLRRRLLAAAIPCAVALAPAAAVAQGSTPAPPAAAPVATPVATPVARPVASSPVAARADHPLVTEARAAQKSFERSRREGLRFYNGGAEAQCEERIGRLCYWNNNGDVPPLDERANVVTEREELIALLGRAAAADPRDDWAAAQRVRYLDEAKRPADAIAAAAACAGTPWWCAALRGTAAHIANRHADATAAFDSALALMPAAERCAWRDLSLWLGTKEREGYKALGCDGTATDARAGWERRFWWLAQPLWMLEGNDARNELAARRVITRAHAMGGIPYDMTYGDDMAESELRYGWPVAWSVQTAGALDPRAPSVIGHEPTPSFDFTPRAAALASPATAPADAWKFDEALPRTRYAPRYAPRGFVPLSHQIARFRRGDSAVVVGAWDVETDRDWGSGTVRVGLGLADSTGPRVLTRAADQPRRGAVRVTTAAVPALLSLEVLGEKQGRAARARYAIEPLAAGAPLSDVLLLRKGAGATPTLEAVLPDALGANRIRAGTTFGVYWESYRPASPGAPAEVSLTATRLNTTRMERARRALRVGSAVRPVAVRFQDTGRPDGQPGRTLTVTWPEVPPGEYRVELIVTPVGGTPATTVLHVRVDRAD